ncbi:MAG: CoA transferase [Hyphomicrobiaceae bacterium]
MKPLDDIRVLDLSRVVSGPFCTMQLGDMGADVIKVEEPEHGDDTRAFGPPFVAGEAAYYLSVNRSKRSLALNLKAKAALPILKSLIERSDVLIENFRPGAADRLGLDYETVSGWNPRIVYCSISGFGTTGPERDRPGYDLIVQGASGIMDITGDPAGPPMKVGTSVADLVTALYGAQAILLALRARDRSGRGQRIEVAMVEAMASLLTFNAGIFFASGRSPTRRGNSHATIVPYETFRAADGWINLGVANDALWVKFCNACGLEAVRDDPRFRRAPDRVENREALLPMINATMASRSRAEWVHVLGAAGVPCGEIRTVGEVCTNEALQARGMIRDLPHSTIGQFRTIDTPMRLDDTPGGAELAPPLLGEHTMEILTELAGLSAAEVERLAEAGVVRCGQGSGDRG